MDQSVTLIEFISGLLAFTFLNVVVPYFKKRATDRAALKETANLRREQERVAHEYAAKLEEIKNQNNLILENARNQNSLRTVAAEKRLEVHAKLSTHLLQALQNLNDCTQMYIGKDLKSFFRENGVYIYRETFVAVEAALLAIWVRNSNAEALNAGHIEKEKFQSLLESLMQPVLTAYNSVFDSVDLPPMKHE